MLGVSLRRLIQLTPDGVFERNRSCRAYHLKTSETIDDEIAQPVLEILFRTHCKGSENNYLSTFRFSGFGKVRAPLDHSTWVRCTCPYFLYYLEVALTRHNSSDIKYSNGAYPMIRNPKVTPYLCKHLLSAVNPAVTILQREMRKKEREERQASSAPRLSGLLSRLLQS